MIRVLVIAAGAVVKEFYCPALRKLEKADAVRVMGVVDPDQSRASMVAGTFRAAQPFSSAEAAFAANSYDLAVIASPAGLHADLACLALEHGSHVLCEKPMTVSTAEAARMNSAAERAERVLGIAHTRRFFPNFADVAALIAAGELGDDVQFTFREGGALSSWPAATGAAFQRERSGGGALMDKGSHMLDQLGWLFGDPNVTAAFDDSLIGGVDTNALLQLEYPTARGTVQISWEYSLNNGLRIWGSAGEIVLDGENIRHYRRKRNTGWTLVPATTSWPADMEPIGGKRVRPSSYVVCMELQFVAMLRRIAYGERFPVTGVQAARTQAAIERAYEISQPLPCPWLPEDEQRAAREKHWKVTQTR